MRIGGPRRAQSESVGVERRACYLTFGVECVLPAGLGTHRYSTVLQCHTYYSNCLAHVYTLYKGTRSVVATRAGN